MGASGATVTSGGEISDGRTEATEIGAIAASASMSDAVPLAAGNATVIARVPARKVPNDGGDQLA